MKILLLSLLLISFAGNVFAMNVPEATEKSIGNDCHVTAELSVMLLKMKAKTPPEQLYQSAQKLLHDKGYQGSFGDAEFIAGMYTGSALQMGPEVDQFMAGAEKDDLVLMVQDHEMDCLEKAMTEYSRNNPATRQLK